MTFEEWWEEKSTECMPCDNEHCYWEKIGFGHLTQCNHQYEYELSESVKYCPFCSKEIAIINMRQGLDISIKLNQKKIALMEKELMELKSETVDWCEEVKEI